MRKLVVLIISVSFVLQYGQAQEVKRILFIGNSYTYFWNLPQTVQAMCATTGDTIEARQSTIGGANLGQHWRSDRELESRGVLENQSWDAVVLQDFSMSAVNTPDSLHLYGSQWVEAILQKGATPHLYMTWAREFNPLMIDDVSREYEKLGANSGALVVPVGRAWSLATQLRPSLELYDPDGSHPSHIGTYLTACLFYQAFTKKSAKGLSHRLIARDSDGEKLYLTILSPGDALFCQEVAARVGRGE